MEINNIAFLIYKKLFVNFFEKEVDKLDINAAMQNQIASVRHAISMSTMQKALSQDGASVSKLLEGMQETTQAIQEAAGPGRGNFVNFRA